MKEKFKPGDIAYVVVYHNKDHKHIEYYVDKVRVCTYYKGANRDYYYIDHKFNNEPLSNACTAKRSYRPHRLFKTYEEAEQYAEYKNIEKQLRDKYNVDKEKLKEKML